MPSSQRQKDRQSFCKSKENLVKYTGQFQTQGQKGGGNVSGERLGRSLNKNSQELTKI
ncbi:hypothetical protein ES705_06298 [subsurface metagenome]